MKKVLILMVLTVFLAGAMQLLHAGTKPTNKSWSKIKDIFK